MSVYTRALSLNSRGSFFFLQSFDRDGDFELEAARRNSAGMALSGYSSSIDGTAITITIDSEAGYNCKWRCVATPVELPLYCGH